MSTLGFIGGGRVARILLGGWVRAGSFPHAVLVCEPDDAAFAKLAEVASRVERVAFERVVTADIVLLALHPPQIAPALAAMRGRLAPGAILVSLAPKITLDQLSADGGTPRTARVIPNAPSLVGRGYNPVAFGPGLDASARAALIALLGPLGTTPQVNERDLEAFAILTGMGPTYFWPQFQALREVARQLGLSPDAADAGLGAMIDGTVATLLDGSLSPAAVMDLVPVKPLSAQEPGLIAMYHDVLPALHAKIVPAAVHAASSTQHQGESPWSH
jgi:pyrroline-5-carboxylate reductase